MRKSMLAAVLLLMVFGTSTMAQVRKKTPAKTPPAKPSFIPAEKKYPSLLWEISGKGMKKSSYLFGTMHVSDKLAFHLGDTFYNAIKGVEVVALETNPDTWQDDYSKSIMWGAGRRGMGELFENDYGWSRDHLRINTFAIDGYEEPLKAILAVEPSMINGMLYRTYGTRTDDFEEDTFLDMYIFQVGKKLGKRMTGVENFEESEKLVREAYIDMMRDRNRKKKSYDMEDMMTNPRKVEDAYRKGDLDMLDSLEALTVYSDAFQEKFLYKRNEIQANSIDSIIKKQTLFVGVGAAHLPGKRGVIEMLRQMGYTVRPVIMDGRNSLQKESLEKARVEHAFVQQTADDGFYKVKIPGKKFYTFTDWQGMNVVQYADLVNGAYYMVTRMKTNSLALGHSQETVANKLDSVLYENVPGKILKKTPITRNGYKGLDILNRTRRGDHQRYNIFITPFEVVIFKISGNGEYVLTGTEATNFFGSIELKEYGGVQWQNWQPATGGFSADLPHVPVLLKDLFGTDRLEYSAWDKQDGNSYLIMKVNLHNLSFIEEDSFDLNLMEESYAFSSFIDKQVSRKWTSVKGYPALDSKYQHKDGSYSNVRYVIQGPLYYVVAVRYKQENTNVKRFLESFTIRPFIYPEVKARVDTSMYFTVQSPVFPAEDKKDELGGMDDMYRALYEEMAEGSGIRDYKNKYIGNDTTGEKILVFYRKLPPYMSWKDSTAFWKEMDGYDTDSTFIRRLDKSYNVSKELRCREQQWTDTGSSRLLMRKTFYTNGHLFSLSAVTDTLTTRSSFLQNFFDTYKPADTLKGGSLFASKSALFMKDLFSKDSLVAKKARKSLDMVKFDSLDAPLLKKAIDSLNWSMYDYPITKNHFITQLRKAKDTATTAWLKALYWKIGDTVVFQHAILNTLAAQRTKTSFATFKELILTEPPIADGNTGEDYSMEDMSVTPGWSTVIYPNEEGPFSGNFWYHLRDTMSLTKTIFPDLMQLMNIDDYEADVMQLMEKMVDSGVLKAADYESYFSRMYIEAKQTLKKQVAEENNDKMERASRKDKQGMAMLYGYLEDDSDRGSDRGNAVLERYATLLLPFREKHPGVQAWFEQLLKTGDRRLVYNTFYLLLRNKQPVPDSLFMKYAKMDQYRTELYGDLKKLSLTDKFPAQYKNQQEITRGLLIADQGSYEKTDTLVYLDKLPVTCKGKKGYVHFYKFKRMRDDASWQIAAVGMQPEKATEVSVDNDDFTAGGGRKLDKDKPVKEQLEKMLKEMLVSKHRSAGEFYEGRNLSLYKPYLAEMVKRRRYKD